MPIQIEQTSDDSHISASPETFDRKAFIDDFLAKHRGAGRDRVDASLDVALAAASSGSANIDLVSAVEKLLSLG